MAELRHGLIVLLMDVTAPFQKYVCWTTMTAHALKYVPMQIVIVFAQKSANILDVNVAVQKLLHPILGIL